MSAWWKVIDLALETNRLQCRRQRSSRNLQPRKAKTHPAGPGLIVDKYLLRKIQRHPTPAVVGEGRAGGKATVVETENAEEGQLRMGCIEQREELAQQSYHRVR